MVTSHTTQFRNCRVLSDGKIRRQQFWIRGGKIIDPENVFYGEKTMPHVIIDCNDCLIVPGFIDVQINGGYGYDFSSETDKIREAVSMVSKGLLSTGVTSFCPTLVTSPAEIYKEVLPKIPKQEGGAHGAGILGVHVEGPFINPKKKGAHPPEHMKIFDENGSILSAVYGSLDNIAIVTVAPEMPNVLPAIREMTKRGIIVSVGHSEGNLEDGEAAVIEGASFITHLFNGMLPFHHRDPGLVGLLTSRLVNKMVYFGIISDGLHTHPAALRIAHRTHPKGLVLITDAMAALGLGEGFHTLGQLPVEVKDNRAYVADTKTLAGSIATMDACISKFIKLAAVTVVEGVEAATLHPAQLLGITDRKGTLEPGTDADFLMLNVVEGKDECFEKITVERTYINGECVYRSDDARALTVIKY